MNIYVLIFNFIKNIFSSSMLGNFRNYFIYIMNFLRNYITPINQNNLNPVLVLDIKNARERNFAIKIQKLTNFSYNFLIIFACLGFLLSIYFFLNSKDFKAYILNSTILFMFFHLVKKIYIFEFGLDLIEDSAQLKLVEKNFKN